MPPRSPSEDDEPDNFRENPMTVHGLDERDIETVNDQMTREIFRLAGRNPTDHASCFQVCVQMVNDTDVIHATDFKLWEKHQYVQNGLDSLQSAQGPDYRYRHDPDDPNDPGTVWMMNAPVAVAAAAALNLPRIHIQKDSRLICTFNKSELWGWIGSAIDFWSSLSGPIISNLPRGAIVHLLHIAKTTNESGRTQPTLYQLQPITLPLFVHLRISQTEIPAQGEHWLQEQDFSEAYVTHREEAMEKGYTSVLAKLGSEHHDQAFLEGPIDGWLTEDFIRVLPKYVKDKLWIWCLQHHSQWQTSIAQATEDLTECYTFRRGRKIFARLASSDLQKCLDHGRCLVEALSDDVSRSILEKLSKQMRVYFWSEAPRFPYLTSQWREMNQRLIHNLSLVGSRTETPGKLFMGPQGQDERNALTRVIQQVVDASICVTPKCPALVDAWLVLLPLMDYTLLPGICFDTTEAKKRRALAKRSPSLRDLGDKEFSKMATLVNSIDPKSMIVAYAVFNCYLPRMFRWEDSALLERCLGPHKTLIAKMRVKKRPRTDFES